MKVWVLMIGHDYEGEDLLEIYSSIPSLEIINEHLKFHRNDKLTQLQYDEIIKSEFLRKRDSSDYYMLEEWDVK